MHEELIVAGAGGQGIVLIGELLCLAVTNKKETTGFPSYGATMRTGRASYTIIVSSEEIGSPISEHPDSLIVMNNPSLLKFVDLVKPGGLIIANKSLVNGQISRNDLRVAWIRANDIAQDLGNSMAANLVMLGAYLKEKQIVTPEDIKTALRELAPKKKWSQRVVQLNERALEKGFNE